MHVTFSNMRSLMTPLKYQCCVCDSLSGETAVQSPCMTHQERRERGAGEAGKKERKSERKREDGRVMHAF